MTDAEKNVSAFLKFIRYAEHHREDDDVYFLLYGGQQSFTDTTQHPNKAIRAWGRTSTAAGAYQILYSTWKEAKDKAVVSDFSKSSQDKLAISKLKSRKALGYVEKGDLDKAIPLLRKEWTSMPGAAQSKMTLAEAQKLFKKYLAELAHQ